SARSAALDGRPRRNRPRPAADSSGVDSEDRGSAGSADKDSARTGSAGTDSAGTSSAGMDSAAPQRETVARQRAVAPVRYRRMRRVVQRTPVPFAAFPPAVRQTGASGLAANTVMGLAALGAPSVEGLRTRRLEGRTSPP